MVDTEVSSLKVVGEDMVWAKAAMQEVELEESNTECMAAWSRAPRGHFSSLTYIVLALWAPVALNMKWGGESKDCAESSLFVECHPTVYRRPHRYMEKRGRLRQYLRSHYLCVGGEPLVPVAMIGGLWKVCGRRASAIAEHCT
jgi:hypothetical protein